MKTKVLITASIVAFGVAGYYLYGWWQSQQTLAVGVISDIDYCQTRNPYPPERVAAFTDYTDTKKTDFNVSLGDNISHRLRDCSDFSATDLPKVLTWLRAASAPTHFALGDHDIASEIASAEFWLAQTDREKTYYSFDVKNVHVVVLDTVLGGDPMAVSCDDDPACQELEKKRNHYRTLFKEPSLRADDDEAAAMTDEQLEGLYRQFDEQLTTMRDEKKVTRSSGRRDRGRVGDEQLQWLCNDLSQTRQSKVLVLSDHPLFPFANERKEYNIDSGQKVRDILEGAEKTVVAISGEAHVWHRQERNGVTYFIVDEFKKGNGTWALFEWQQDEFRLTQVAR